ncbi:hypothetical protein EIP86_010398 [Pleurotus ostreatoroseus]|nr:hypothetical protein EIP86_010398 [Pleurotus ostreatoroseus]
MSVRSVFVVAGLGNGTGTGGATARAFAKAGYKVALISRNAHNLNNIAKEIERAGGEAAAFPVNEYSYSAILSMFAQVKAYRWGSGEPAEIRVALWNAAAIPFKPFLEEHLKGSLDAFVISPFAFARQAILTFQKNSLTISGNVERFFSPVRGRVFGLMSSGLRSLRASLVAHVVVDGQIINDFALSRRSGLDQQEFKANPDIRLLPDRIAKVRISISIQGER